MLTGAQQELQVIGRGPSCQIMRAIRRAAKEVIWKLTLRRKPQSGV